jgi:hypothetical protein
MRSLIEELCNQNEDSFPIYRSLQFKLIYWLGGILDYLIKRPPEL